MVVAKVWLLVYREVSGRFLDFFFFLVEFELSISSLLYLLVICQPIRRTPILQRTFSGLLFQYVSKYIYLIEFKSSFIGGNV